ncbi:MAG: hypothetical protein KatS3mg131_0990 [Candidatus Tectimicrobiota bacterium]|nr:MAG: hypothetical protein KatS3mg131_0990 [Candidatus Tectomicrobia bacterium]
MRAPFGSPVLDAACRLLVPFLLLFALYVLVHGHDSPGGGFQSGTLLAGAVILVRLVRGHPGGWGLERRAALGLACGGVGLYAAIGLASLVFGGHYLDYSALPLPLAAASRRALGILGIEVGVTLGVTGVLVLIFDALVAWEGEEA